jgi:hypothetical protein
MKWYSKDYRKMINLESVNGYVYIPADQLQQLEKDTEDFKNLGDRLELIIGGTPYVFRGEDAKEIYDMLEGHCRKELLKG